MHSVHYHIAVMNPYVEKTIKFVRELPVIGDLFEKRPKVAVLRFSGVISDSQKKQTISHARFAKTLDKLSDRTDLKALALVINSPGGAAAQTSLIADHIRRLSEDNELPVYAFVEDVAASGGYWLACAADKIYCQQSSIVGSVGVIAASFGFEDFIEKHNIHRRVHTAGKDKSFLDPFLPEQPSDIKRLSAIQKEIHQSFIEWVKERRAERLSGADKDLFEGQFWTAGAALEKGMIDGFGDVRSVMKELFGDEVCFVDQTPEKKLMFPFSIMGGVKQNEIAQELLDTIESRAYWSRYGL